jgi:hypothetical protein
MSHASPLFLFDAICAIVIEVVKGVSVLPIIPGRPDEEEQR